MAAELTGQGITCSRNHVAKLLRERGLRARSGKGFRHHPRTEAMTNVKANVLNRDFTATAPNVKWVSDITYIKVGRTGLYLAAFWIYLYSRRIVGWALDTHMRESLILEALDMAVSGRDIQDGALLHTDRGVQFLGHEYQEILRMHGIRCSMSRKGNCWDNAVMESFFSRLKVELIYAESYKTIDEARAGIFEYIEIFLNRKHRHSALGYVSPHEHERAFEELTVSTFRG